MTKKHFIAFADFIRHAPVSRKGKDQMASMVIAIASRDNARFNISRFLTACGLEPKGE